MRTRSSSSKEDLVELVISKRQRKKTQRQQAEPEVVITDTMNDPEGNGNPLGNGLGRARQTRPIWLRDAPNRHQQRQGIFPPPVQNHNFEIKLGMINLVQNKMFHGLSSEDRIDHLDEFDRLCDLTKINGVSEDAIKLRLFPMSLFFFFDNSGIRAATFPTIPTSGVQRPNGRDVKSVVAGTRTQVAGTSAGGPLPPGHKPRFFPMSLADKAHQSEKSLPHGTITTWNECKKAAFLAKFFSTNRTTELRSEISGFTRTNNETFVQAWEDSRYREMLDTASNGNFLHQDVDDGWQLVENIVNSNGSYGEEYDRTDWSSTENSIESDALLRKDMHALNSKLDKLILAQFTVKHVNSVSGKALVQDQEGEDTQFSEICYMNNRQGGYRMAYSGYQSGYG
ncbi:unnamed protein product [Microthlaspi erraticum]|uniref:Retrotransposon gag domain-containing protein n=1 Tax=Microthlaspi erraticum TaxID=1685480 RepID=A0A6D2HQF4_9BRAS|nr:unnamed protein product [Microthlaspi erraticum]